MHEKYLKNPFSSHGWQSLSKISSVSHPLLLTTPHSLKEDTYLNCTKFNCPRVPSVALKFIVKFSRRSHHSRVALSWAGAGTLWVQDSSTTLPNFPSACTVVYEAATPYFLPCLLDWGSDLHCNLSAPRVSQVVPPNWFLSFLIPFLVASQKTQIYFPQIYFFLTLHPFFLTVVTD